MSKVVEMPSGPWGNDAADWPGTAEEWRELMREAEDRATDEPGGDRQGEEASQQEDSALKRVSLVDLPNIHPRAPSFLVRPVIPRRFVTLLGGHGEVGKSMLGLTLGAHVCTGQPWAGLEVEQGKVLYLSMEDAGEMAVYRLKRIVADYALDHRAISANLTIIDASDASPLVQEINAGGVRVLHPTSIAAEVAKLASDYALVIIDNASDAFDGDENSRRQVRNFIKLLASWVKERDAAVLLLVHVDKQAARNGAGRNTYSGSTAWHNSSRSRLALTKNEQNDHIELAHEKLNVGKKLAEPIVLEWTENGTLIPIDEDARQTARRQTDATHDAAVYAAILASVEANTPVPTATTGPVTAWNALCAFPELPDALRERSGKAKVDAAIVRLSRQKMIVREMYRTTGYKTKERWVPCSAY